MTTNIVRVGNSRGIRIPKVFLDECGLSEQVELESRKGLLVIRPVRKVKSVRKGWDEAFRRMAIEGDDRLLDRENLSDWDRNEWKW